MCESPKHGARGGSSFIGTSQHNQSDRFSTNTSNDTFISQIQDRIAVATDSKFGSSQSSPRTCRESHQPIELLANQLRNQSLKQPEGVPRVPQASSRALHQSLPDDDILRLLGDHNNTAMDVDVEAESRKRSTTTRTPNRPVKRFTSENILAMISSESQCSIRPSPPCSNPIVPDPNPETLYRSSTEIHTRPIEVDEGYDEDQDDFSWLESFVSMREASAPSGVTKRFGLRYKTSADAASRCSNLVHSVPRMRRRDKRRRIPSSSAGVTTEGTRSTG